MYDNYFLWKSEKISRYILGTAQLGFDYGISNKSGQPDRKEADSIINSAWAAGARAFDTAQGYGESELILGELLHSNNFTENSAIITKIAPYSAESDGYSWVRKSVERSIKLLSTSSLWAVLLHRYDLLELWDEGLGLALNELKAENKIKHLGVSVYTVEEVKNALRYPDIDIIQAPCNIWSPELYTEGIIKSALESGRLILVRSLFLQGLILMSPDEVTEKIPEAHDASVEWFNILKENDVSAWDMCMRFAAQLRVPVIFGVDNAEQAYSNGSFLKMQSLNLSEITDIYERLKPHLSEKIVNPTMWK